MMIKLEFQVCSYNISKELNKYQLTHEPCFFWFKDNDKSDPKLISNKSKYAKHIDKICPAYSVAELGVLLLNIVPAYTVYVSPVEFQIFNGQDEFGTSEAGTEAELRARMLLRAIMGKNVDQK